MRIRGCRRCACRSAPRLPAQSILRSKTSPTGCGCISARANSAARVYISQPGEAEFGEAHYGLGFQCNSYRGDRLVRHGGGWPGWGTEMAMLPDHGLGVAVFTNRSPSEVPSILT